MAPSLALCLVQHSCHERHIAEEVVDIPWVYGRLLLLHKDNWDADDGAIVRGARVAVERATWQRRGTEA